MASTEHTVGFEPADRLAQDRESLRRRFWIKLKRVVAKLPFAEDLLAAYYCAFDKETPRHVQAALLRRGAGDRDPHGRKPHHAGASRRRAGGVEARDRSERRARIALRGVSHAVVIPAESGDPVRRASAALR